MIRMVRQLAPGESGIPMEIYAFTKDTAWVNYEKVQSDIFDHIYAAAKEFGLRIFQTPSGYDLRECAK
jgi:miniconductance mechanosensitive channel